VAVTALFLRALSLPVTSPSCSCTCSCRCCSCCCCCCCCPSSSSSSSRARRRRRPCCYATPHCTVATVAGGDGEQCSDPCLPRGRILLLSLSRAHTPALTLMRQECLIHPAGAGAGAASAGRWWRRWCRRWCSCCQQHRDLSHLRITRGPLGASGDGTPAAAGVRARPGARGGPLAATFRVLAAAELAIHVAARLVRRAEARLVVLGAAV
jgi:hypothetical protein